MIDLLSSMILSHDNSVTTVEVIGDDDGDGGGRAEVLMICISSVSNMLEDV